MAKCERCGASFDYDERQGVCPRCCFYNRPPGAARQDTEWMKFYNVEDNSYQLPKSEGLEDLFPERGSRWKRMRRNSGQGTEAGTARRSGDGQNASGGAKQSRRHTDYRQVMRKKYRRHADGDGETGKGISVGKVVTAVVILCIVLVAATVFLRIADTRGWSFSSFAENEQEMEESTALQVETRTPEKAAAGIAAGEVTYWVGEVRTLFREGELSDLPAGEKCIGVWLEDNESVMEFTGFGWDRPYVYDGKNYRRMLDADSLDTADRFTESGIVTFPIYGAGFEDERGYGIFFVDADATTVTLSIPCQTTDAEDTDRLEYTGVIDVTLPVTE